MATGDSSYQGDYYSSMTGQQYDSAEQKAAAEAQFMAGQQSQNNASSASMFDPSSPNYVGPGYDQATDNAGNVIARKSHDPTRLIEQQRWESSRGTGDSSSVPTNPNPPTNQTVNGILDGIDTNTTALKDTPLAGRIAAGQKGFNGYVGNSNTARVSRASPPVTAQGIQPTQSNVDTINAAQAQAGTPDTSPYTDPGAEAPKLDTDAINKTLNGLEGYSSDIANLAYTQQGETVAEARLRQAADVAARQQQIQTDASQRAALGAARSTRSRADQALASRQAIGESAFIGQDAARTAALTQAQTEGDLAATRAQEALDDRNFRLNALSKAADLGLNTAALQVDISKTDLESANNWVNQQFQQLGIDKQLDQQQTQAVLGFTRDMAAIQFQYDQMSTQDQEFIDSQIMQKYQIDQQTMVALKQIKAQKQMAWTQVLSSLTGGIGQGASAATGAALLKG